MELLVVVVILAAVAALVVSNVDSARDDAEVTVAQATMHALREAITGSAAAPGYLADMKYVPGFRSVDIRTHDLLSASSYPGFAEFDPVTRRGWNGPYLRNARVIGDTEDLTVADPWGNSIVVQVPPTSAFNGSTGDAKRFRYARLVSAGADGVLTTPLDDRLAGMDTNGDKDLRGDDLVLFLNRADIYEVEEP